jgi:hypothetical protein
MGLFDFLKPKPKSWAQPYVDNLNAQTKPKDAYPAFRAAYPKEEEIVQAFSSALGKENRVFFIRESDAIYSRTTIERAFEKAIKVAYEYGDTRLYDLLINAGSSIGSIYPDDVADRMNAVLKRSFDDPSDMEASIASADISEHIEANKWAIAFIEKYSRHD